MEELLEESIQEIHEDLEETVKNTKEETPQFQYSPEKSASICEDDIDVKVQLQTLTNQVSLLSSSMSKLLDRETKKLKEEEISTKAKKASVASGERIQESVSGIRATKGPIGSASGGVDSLPTTQSLAKDKELNLLLAAYNEGEQEFLSTFSDSQGVKVASISQGEH